MDLKFSQMSPGFGAYCFFVFCQDSGWHLQVLFPATSDTVQKIAIIGRANNNKYFNKSYLLFLVAEKSQLSAVSKQFVDLFSHALTYRSRQQSAAASTADVETAEAAIISAFLLVTLRYTILQSSRSCAFYCLYGSGAFHLLVTALRGLKLVHGCLHN